MKKIKHKPVSSKTEKKQVSLLPEFLKEQRTRILLGIALALVSLYICLLYTSDAADEL